MSQYECTNDLKLTEEEWAYVEAMAKAEKQADIEKQASLEEGGD